MKNKTKPLVSIGLPVQNGEAYLCKAIDSLLAQKYENFELIISNNASTDSTLQICKKYAKKDKRVSLYNQKQNIGLVENFRFVLSKAQGDYFMWASDDDIWKPKFIETLFKELKENPEAGVAMCATKRIYADGTELDTIRFNGEESPNGKDRIWLINKCSALRQKYYFFFCGLFRTRTLKIAMPWYQTCPYADVYLMAGLAFITNFRYINRTDYIRMMYKESNATRYPTEPFNVKRKLGILKSLNFVFTFRRNLIDSKQIKSPYKKYLLTVILKFLTILIIDKVRGLAK